MKQTAVEFLIDNLHYFYSLKWDDIVEKAKEMEKQQIEDAFQQGFNNAYFSNPLYKEQYYNETYKKV